MRRVMGLVLGVGLLLGVAWPGQGAAPPLSGLTLERARLKKLGSELNERLVGLYRQGKVAEAAEVASQALKIQHALYPEKDYPDGHPDLALSLNNLGSVLQATGEPARALGYYEKAQAIRQKLYPPARFPDGHPDLALGLNNLASALGDLGKPAQALGSLEKAMAMRQRLYPAGRHPDGHPDLAASLHNLGAALAAMGEPARALGHYEQALAMNQKLYPPARFPDGHPSVALNLNNLGVVLHAMGEPARALGYHEKALAAYERLYPPARFPDGHPDLARSLNNLGVVLRDLGASAKALERFEKALAAYERLYPPARFPAGHPALATTRNNLGHLLQQVGNPTQALTHYEKSLAAFQKLYPPAQFPDGHPNLAVSLNNVGSVFQDVGASAKALGYHGQALAMYQRLYPPARFPDGHPSLALSHNNVGHSLAATGEYARAVVHYETALAMRQKLYPPARFPNGHPDLATSVNNLGQVFQDVGEAARALGYYEKALAMRQKLYPAAVFPDGHPDLATSLNNLATVLQALGEPARALGYHEEALAMNQKLYPPALCPDGHPDVAMSLSNLGALLHDAGELKKARGYYEKALAIRQKLYPPTRYPDGHPDLATSLNNLGCVLDSLGEWGRALDYYGKALAAHEKLYPAAQFPDGHRSLAVSLSNVGSVLLAMGEPAKAAGYFEKSLGLTRRQAARELAGAPEAQALAFLASRPLAQAGYLSTTTSLPGTAGKSYQAVWPDRVAGFQLMLRRHEAARVALLQSEEASKTWSELGDVRRQVGRLMFAPGKDPSARDQALAKLERDQERLERAMAKLLPAVEAHKQLAQVGPVDLAAKLPAGSAFVDFVRYSHSSNGKAAGDRYLAFVLTPDAPIQRHELGDAKPVDEAITAWRRRITTGASDGQPRARLRELVWDKVEKALPTGTRTVYLGLDGDLTKLPFAALPGRKPDTVLLEDYALAVVPAGQWLLQQLRKPPSDDTAPKLVAAGDIDFGTGAYVQLDGTKRELQRVADAVPGGTALRGKDATVSALRKHLPEARIAHLATHAYFDKKTLDEEAKRIQKARESWTLTREGSTRVGLALRNPLAFVGLLCSGGNDPKTADGGGILTGLHILDLPLNKMQLCVLSACETGLGQWEADAGVAGLQRAFHVSGCRNVVGSLWQVDDDATAALMAKFYHEMRTNKMTPLQALREAQLTVYRHPDRIADLAGRRGKSVTLGAAQRPVAPAAKGKTSPTRLWAAFVLSGPGN